MNRELEPPAGSFEAPQLSVLSSGVHAKHELLGGANGVAKKAPRGSWTKDQKRRIVAASQVAGANLAEVAVIYMSVPAAGQVKVSEN